MGRCDTGGDCECLCTAIANFAAACSHEGLCVSWRSQHLCGKMVLSPSVSVLPVHAPITSSHSVNSPLSPSITPFLLHSRLKTYLFHRSFPPQTPFHTFTPRKHTYIHTYLHTYCTCIQAHTCLSCIFARTPVGGSVV